jgi:EAL and modified HD-GYP domain-containing signal transduction protein
VSASPQPSSAAPIPLLSDSESYTRYIARQPILNREQNTHGYELLFRSGPENFFRSEDPDEATCNTIDFSLLLGSVALTGGHPAYINCTRNVLLREVITLLPRDRVVIEVLEDVIADEKTLEACGRLRRAGYLIALDDYVPTADSNRLLPFADMVKVDFLNTDAASQASIAGDMRRRRIKLVAEKVETREQFQYAMSLGYHYFQGYFFCKPETLSLHDIPCSKLSYIHALSIANRYVFAVDELEKAILREPSLCYRLLRYLNSAAFGLFPVRSIRHALTLLGQREVQKWVSIVVAISIAGDQPNELISSALTRARSCETLAATTGGDTCGAFMVGLISLMDAILDCPMKVLISQLPLSSECKEALQGEENSLGKMLQLAVCCERGAWQEVTSIAFERSLPEDAIWDIYRQARQWSSEILQENALQQ